MVDYTFELVRDPDRLQLLASEWDELYAQCLPANPCVSHAWASACWESVRDQVDLFIVLARREGKLVGVAPLRRERHLGLRRLSFLGRGASPYVAFLCDPTAPHLEQAMLGSLATHGSEWDFLRLDQLSEPFTALHHPGQVGNLRLLQQPCPWQGASYHTGD